MQSLLEDPEFYKLLVNNTESLPTSKSSTSPQSTSSSISQGHSLESFKSKDLPNHFSIPITQVNKKHKSKGLQNSSLATEQVDFSFLKKLEFPTLKSNDMMQSSIASEISYQSSIFSAPYNSTPMNDEAADNYNPLDEFFSRDISLQINNEMTHMSNMPQPLAYQVMASPQQGLDQQQLPRSVNVKSELKDPQHPMLQANDEIAQTAQQTKQFHKFYSGPLKKTPPSMGITKLSSQLSSSPSSSTAVASYHRCPFCERQFKNKSYLSRHLKKHDEVKDFKCPFFHEEHAKCHHLNGEFSRKDTFKAHLKSIHFIYPVGVFKCDRNLSIGRCAGCFKEFSNNNEWLSKHIDSEECPSLAKFKNFEAEC